MSVRTIAGAEIAEIGFGCMTLSHAYGTPPDPETGERLLHAAIDAGYTHLDTATLYGGGANETLVGRALKGRRGEVHLASKCVLALQDGKRILDGRPETLKRQCDESLSRLQTDVIDLYYLHRVDPDVRIEESVGALAECVQAGKIRAIGLSEMSAATMRRAHAVHAIAAMQSEYSLWTRNPEVAVLDTCRELGITLVAFSPLGRGFLTGRLRDTAVLPAKDIRHNMPRFQSEHFSRNLALLDALGALAREQGCTMGQLALAWLLAQGEGIIPIPGTTRLDHLEENVRATEIVLDRKTIDRLNALINPRTVSGARYSAATQAEIDTEEIPA